VNLETNSDKVETEGDFNLNKCERVKTCIDTYLSMNPRLTLQNVEDKTSVPYSTLRRIVNLNGNPQPEGVIKIYQALGYDQELYQYMSDFHPEIASVMAMKTSHNQEYSYIKDEDREYFISEDYFLIMNLAYTTSGTSLEEVAHELGTKGVERLNILLEKGIVKKNIEGKFIGMLEKYKLSFADTKKRIELSFRYYRLEEAGNINNWMSFQTASLNGLGIKEFKSLQQKQYNERKEFFDRPIYNGDEQVYCGALSSTFRDYKEPGELQ
jgi:hypothetical protein